MNSKRIIITLALWGFLAGYPLINSMSILTWIESTLGGIFNPILGSGFAAFAPVIVDGASFVVLFFALDKVGATKAYSVPAAN